MTSVTDGYDRICKAGDSARNLEAQLHILYRFEICGEHMLSDGMADSSFSRTVSISG